ncbi:MAG TPA: CvpA family protein [Clostridiales bacterium]|nr:CvpA family protein [Clostridiales bacterium]
MDSLPIIVDVVIALLVVIITVSAVKKGFFKTIFGLISAILVIVVAVYAASPLTNLVADKSQLDEKLESSIQGGLSSKIPNAYAEILYYDLDSDGTNDLAFKPEGSDEYHPYEEIFAGSTLKFLRLENIMRKTAESNLDPDDPESYITVVHALSKTLAIYVFLACSFIIIAIVAKIIFFILTKLLIKASENLYFMNFVDKLLGGIFGFALAALVILAILALLQVMINNFAFMEAVDNFLQGSYVTKFLMEKNFAYDFFAKNVSIDKVKGFFGG